MGRIEKLVERYGNHVSAPWQRNLAGDQKAIFVVYPKTDERKLRARLDLFEMATTSTGHAWRLLDITDAFACWMANLEYRESYFEDPDGLKMKLQKVFLKHASDLILQALTAEGVDDGTVVAVLGVADLFGFTRLSMVLKEVVKEIRGRLLVFFPGEYEEHNYRLLDARDGWDYLAVPITLYNGMND